MSRRRRLIFYAESGFLNVQSLHLHIRTPISEDFDFASQQAASLMYRLHAELLFRHQKGDTGLWQL